MRAGCATVGVANTEEDTDETFRRIRTSGQLEFPARDSPSHGRFGVTHTPSNDRTGKKLSTLRAPRGVPVISVTTATVATKYYEILARRRHRRVHRGMRRAVEVQFLRFDSVGVSTRFHAVENVETVFVITKGCTSSGNFHFHTDENVWSPTVSRYTTRVEFNCVPLRYG